MHKPIIAVQGGGRRRPPSSRPVNGARPHDLKIESDKYYYCTNTSKNGTAMIVHWPRSPHGKFRNIVKSSGRYCPLTWIHRRKW
jgi:hypothetical protein